MKWLILIPFAVALWWCIRQIILIEIEYKRKKTRLMQAYKLHLKVLDEYGVEAADKLASMEQIMNDDKPITIINYLNTDWLKIK